jgi:hypothetical protein
VRRELIDLLQQRRHQLETSRRGPGR